MIKTWEMPQTVVHVFRAADGTVPLAGWLNELEEREPLAYRKCLQRILRLAAIGNELRRPLADILRDGIYELRIKVGSVNYRILYFFCGSNVAYLSHGLTKKSKVPSADIDLAINRKSLVTKEPDKYTAELEA